MSTKQFILGAPALVAVALLSNLPFSGATEPAALHDEKPDYPPQSKDESFYVLHVQPDTNVLCGYGNETVRNGQLPQLQISVRRSSIRTSVVRCPKTGDWDAFELKYTSRNLLWWDKRNYNSMSSYGYSFLLADLPSSIRQDPLRALTYDAGHAISRLYPIGEKPHLEDRFRITLSDFAEARENNDNDMLEVIKTIDEVCSAAMTVLKKRYPTFDDLCADYDTTAKIVHSAAGKHVRKLR
ncbi:hypothetical protein FOZ63_008135 [Perkinsus olseni]|uniref:Uncharacterized protein n=1 Tax=Perkinsus olseni TaxID=32597 RepID=A0A7J6TA37_PEROL|nr:hypothetical protein FOZ62_007409 [Perkinsus olseni]KAF4742108.1 hypothetical protein FOZ63_008135 [Perkinsus olseni]